jgi:hypothetical protein
LTGGVAPALAAPGSPGAPSTTVAPQPNVEAPQAPAEKPEKQADAPAPKAEKPASADAPEPVTPAPVVVAPTAQAPVEAPAPSRAQESAPSDAPIATQAPEPTSAPAVVPTRQAPTTTATSVAPTASREAPSSSAPAPAPSATAGPVAPTAEEPSGAAPSEPAAPSVSGQPSPALVAPNPGRPADPAGTPTSPEAQPSGAQPSVSDSSTEPARDRSETSSATTSQPAQRVIEKVAPKTLEAPEQDVQLAQSAKIVEEKPVAAPKQEIDDISRIVDLPNRDNPDNRADRDRQPFDLNGGQRDRDQVRLAGDRSWDRNVRQWRPDWVQYDEYYRPVLSNPYRDPVRIVYIYQNAPRVVYIPPLARIVLEVAQYAAYSFTAVVQNTVQTAVNVAVGSFFGGGYFPGVGLPLPPPPPPLLNYANVPVQVRYSDATYQPFRVSKVVDVGDDAQYGERKVLLDGVTPAWGQWKQTPSGERSFEVHKTQQFPGLDEPREAPLPGDYQLTLASDESPSGMNKRDVYLIAVAVACGALSIGAVVLSVVIGRRRRAH